jgi:hypothetical protein
MPWNVDDVEKHKKGLSEKGKKQWTRIANSILKKEMKKGRTEEEAAVSAIKQANGVVMNVNSANDNYGAYKNKQVLDYELKLTVHQEKAHIVAPVVMMVEGVHHGSQGPLFHSIGELGKFPASWNGIPIVIYHPEEDGQAVSANSPDIIDKEVVGRVYNTNVDGKKLKAEIWLDEDKLNTVSPGVLKDMNDGKEIEVSLGMFTENDMTAGVYEGQDYIGVAKSHRPDHLAILPDQIGACSCAKGCGIGANAEKVSEMINTLSTAGFAVNQITNNVEQEYQKRLSMAYDALRLLDEHTYHYLEELYTDYLIYSKSEKEGTKMYKQSYKIESGKIEFVGSAVEVHKKVEYVVNRKLTRTNFNTNNKQEDVNMKNECPKCVEKINALIANTQSGFVEADREWLDTLTEAALDKVAPKVIEKEKIVEKTVEVNVMSADDKAALAAYRKEQKDKKDAKIKQIMDNSEQGVWTAEELGAMKDEVLDKIAGLVQKEEKHDFSVNGAGVFNTNSSKEEPLAPTGVTFETAK